MNKNTTELTDGIVKANALYRSGNYQEALSIYEQVASRPGWARLVSANVALCRKRLELPIKLSVVVPVFNSGKYLKKCLQSILKQVEVSLEVIVINDGSSDDSLDIIRQTMQQDKRIVLINNNKPSGNPGTPRNQGIAIAKGEYLGFVDSDDWIDPDYFACLVEAIEADSLDIAFAAGYTNHHNDESKIVSYNALHFNGADEELYGYHESFMIWDKVYRTSLIKSQSIKLGETKAAVDVPFIFKAYYLMKKAGFADTKGYHYRRESESSVTVNFRKSSNCDFEIQAYKDVEEWCRDAGVTAQYNNLVNYRKVSSYIYTLSVIAPNEFHTFFVKIKPELTAIDGDLIAKISKKLKRPLIFEKFKAITTGDADAYLKAYRSDLPKAVPTVSAKSADDGKKGSVKPVRSPLPTFKIEGTKMGVLFFPDWSPFNPYQKLFYASLAQNFNVRIKGYQPGFLSKKLLDENKKEFSYLHLQWLHALMDVSREDGADNILSTLEHAKKLGYKTIYTAHNILSHDSIFHERELTFRRKIVPYFDHVLVHGELARQRIIDEIGGGDRNKIHVMPHGTYQGYYPDYVTRETARQKLGIAENKFVFLFFGNIKGYKGINALLDAYRKIRSKRDDVVLVIAGRVFDTESKSKIDDYASLDPSVLFNPGFIEDSDVQYYFNSADLVVLPYTRILTSGAALLSVAFNRPVIAPRSGLIPELIEDGKQGVLFDDYDDMLALMERAVVQQRKNTKAWADSFNFSDLNDKLRWPLLTAHPAFSQIFSDRPRTEDYVVKRSRYRYALVRILGNDLPLRHSQDQTYNNLKFTLEHEKEFEDCLKLWVLNRIADAVKKQNLIELLSKHGKRYIDIPYEVEAFAQAGYCFEDLPKDTYKLTSEFMTLDEREKLIVDNVILKHKNNYIINNNGARNRALQEGMQHADWVFPWDGNCFVAEKAWASITAALRQRADLQCHIVPMERLLDNRDVLKPDHVPNPSEEPQLIFRKDAALRFNEQLMYGFKPKIELLKRLGVSGVWDKWNQLYPWRKLEIGYDSHTYNYSWAGWVSRLFSGNWKQECDALQRAIARERSVTIFIHTQERAWFYRNYKRGDLVFYDERLLKKIRTKKGGFGKDSYAGTLAKLEDSAREYFANPLYSVIDKTTLPPSKDKQDYWHPAPYCWPNPASPDGLPYIYKDGERVPGTRMYEAQSNKYDRTAIQRVFDETTALALAGYVFSTPAYTEKAAKLIRRWFIDEKTAMNPHLTFSQVIMGKNENRGTASGLIETKDMYFFLDAVRLVRKSDFWREEDEQKMLAWCKNFLVWLNTSDQGRQEVASINNHGVAFDLQTYALAAFIGDVEEMYAIFLRALSRMKEHVDKNGMQPHEMKRTTTAHYTAFNLHLWLNLSVLLRRTAGFNLFNEERDYGGVKLNPLKKATSWVLARAAGDWPFKQIDEFDKERYQHLYHTVSRHSPAIREKFQGVIKSFSESKVVFFPHDGIAPFWTLQG